jgi:DNA-binding PadR family transcriptional regulator
MGEGESERRVAPMQSAVNWALLGLIIERPSYAYELARRFERTYADSLSLSSVSYAYVALGALKDRGLIEEIAGGRSARQPKPHYRATATGLAEYHDWLIGQVTEERRRQTVFLLQLTALTRDPEEAMMVLADYERACLDETCAASIASEDDNAPDAIPGLQARLIAEERRLAIGAKIAWARYARSEIKALAEARADGRTPEQ